MIANKLNTINSNKKIINSLVNYYIYVVLLLN